MTASTNQTYEQATLRTAFCILPQNLDEHLAFYTGVLGLEVIRRDEGFVRFNTTPAIICLWEIGHIHKHLGFADPGPVVASKSIVVLDVPSETIADGMAAGCRALGLQPMAILGTEPGTKGFTVRDPNACYWTISVKAGATPAHVERFGVIAEDFDKSVSFYRDVMKLRPVGASTSDTAHFAASDVVSFDIVRRSSIPGIAPLTDIQRSAHLTMPALGYRLCAEVDAAAARLRRGGARLTADPVKHEWNFYVAYFTDPDANIWEIFTPLPEGTTSTISGRCSTDPKSKYRAGDDPGDDEFEELATRSPSIDKVLSFDLAGAFWRAGVVKREKWTATFELRPSNGQKH